MVMNEKKTNKSVIACLIIFAIMIAVHGFEAIVLRMDETLVGENFINKVFGIIVVFLLSVVLVAFCVSLLHAVTARLRIEQIFKYYWTVVSALALLSLVLVWYGL